MIFSHIFKRIHLFFFIKTGDKQVFFDAGGDAGKTITPKWVTPEEEQEPNESRRYVHKKEMFEYILKYKQIMEEFNRSNQQ